MTHDNEGTVSLRDWFAGQALVGLISQMKPGERYSTMAVECFVAADAMLSERAKTAPQRDKLSAIERELVEALEGKNLSLRWTDVGWWGDHQKTDRRVPRALAAWYANAKERL